MNYITIALIALTAVPILFGALLGLMRGTRRALLRLILVVISIAVAFLMCKTVTKPVMNMNIGALGGSVENYLKQALLSKLPESLSEYAVPIVQSIMQVAVFLLSFFLVWLLTWAVAYPLCKLFVKKGAKPRRLIGLAIGAVQGVIVTLCVCAVLTGLLVQTNNVMAAVSGIQEITSSSTTEDSDAPRAAAAEEKTDEEPSVGSNIIDMIGDFANSPLGKFYDKIGAKPFTWLTQVKLENGSKITLPGQIEAIRGVVDMAKEISKLKDFDFVDLFKEGNIEALTEMFNQLSKIQGSLSNEAKDTINGMFKSFAKEVTGDMGIDFKDVDVTKVDFKKEGEIFANLSAYKGKELEDITDKDVDAIIDNLVDSDIMLDVLQKQDGVNLGAQLQDPARVEKISDKIDALEQDESVSREKIDALRQIFGLSA